LFHAPGFGWKQFKNYHLKAGEALLFQQVRLFKRHPVETVNVVFAREAKSGELWLIVSSEPTNLQTLREYSLRFDIETLFGIFKTPGFCLESTHFTDAERLSKLFALLT
jgi:hypothetical protein